MDEYSSFGSSLVILPPADRVLKVSPKRGPGDRKGRKRKEAKRITDHDAKGQSIASSTGRSELEEEGEAKGSGIDIVI